MATVEERERGKVSSCKQWSFLKMCFLAAAESKPFFVTADWCILLELQK